MRGEGRTADRRTERDEAVVPAEGFDPEPLEDEHCRKAKHDSVRQSGEEVSKCAARSEEETDPVIAVGRARPFLPSAAVADSTSSCETTKRLAIGTAINRQCCEKIKGRNCTHPTARLA